MSVCCLVERGFDAELLSTELAGEDDGYRVAGRPADLVTGGHFHAII